MSLILKWKKAILIRDGSLALQGRVPSTQKIQHLVLYLKRKAKLGLFGAQVFVRTGAQAPVAP